MRYFDYINVLMGTHSDAEFSFGNTLPLTAFPFGTNHFTPETRTKHLIFNSEDSRTNGIRLTHMFSPWIGDYNYMTFCAAADDGIHTTVIPGKHCVSTYRASESVFTPSLCRLRLNLYDSLIELTPTAHGGIIRATWNKESASDYLTVNFGENGKAQYSIDKDKNTLSVTSKTLLPFHSTIKGDFRIFSVFSFDKEIVDVLQADNGIAICFGKGKNSVTAHFAASFISTDQALCNLDQEVAGKDFITVKNECEDKWESYLSKIEIAEDAQKMKTFYSCMYRCFLFPRAFHEKCPDGKIRHFSMLNGEICDGPLYTDHCFWDTYKTLFALYSIIDSELYKEMCLGFLNFYNESGWLPRCTGPSAVNCMPGTAVDAVFADAITKNVISDKDVIEQMLCALEKHAYNRAPDPAMGRDGIDDFNTLGYVSTDYKESVNKTLDYAYGNFCIAKVAQIAGYPEKEKKLIESAKNYRSLFDKETGFFRAKNKNGEMRSDFKDTDWGGDYTEGSAWQNSFAVYHDIYGYATLLGGKDAFAKKLDQLFSMPPVYTPYGYEHEIHEMSEMAAYPEFGQCALSNQPSFHIPYLYSCIGDRDKTSYWVKKAVKELFSATPKGFPGDEDTGSMAAWYIFSNLGFYPVCPSSEQYVLASPSVKKAVIHLDNGKTFTVNTKSFDDEKNYAKSIKLNKNPLSRVFVTHQEIKDGGALTFAMSYKPSLQKYTDDALPYSLSNTAK